MKLTKSQASSFFFGNFFDLLRANPAKPVGPHRVEAPYGRPLWTDGWDPRGASLHEAGGSFAVSKAAWKRQYHWTLDNKNRP